MRKHIWIILGLFLILVLASCAGVQNNRSQNNIFETGESQAKLRSIQSRTFDITDRNRLLRIIIATLQDLGFVIDDADETLGTVSGTKRARYSLHTNELRMTVSIRPRGTQQMIIRGSAQNNLQTVEDPEPYQQFFSALSRALFFEGTVNSIAGNTVNNSQKGQKLASISKDVSFTEVYLRRQPVEISNEMKITNMLAEYDFFDRTKNPQGSFENALINNNDGTVTDRATSLMWQMSGSSSSLDSRSAKEYVKQLNRQRFAGYADWRIPTIEELASLMKRTRRNGVYIDPVFDDNQTTCWSADTSEGINSIYIGIWIVDFRQAQILKADDFKSAGHTAPVSSLRKNYMNYVKAVRSAK